MSYEDPRKAADSLMKHLRLSYAQAAVLLDETTIPPTLRVYVFDKELFTSRKWPKQLEWHGYGVQIISSTPFTPLARTRDQDVRAQIEAAKAYLSAQGFSDVEDPPMIQRHAFERNLHTIQMSWRGEKRILRLSYSWLEERGSEDVRRWLTEKRIADRMKMDPDANVIGILRDGTINYEAIQF